MFTLLNLLVCCQGTSNLEVTSHTATQAKNLGLSQSGKVNISQPVTYHLFQFRTGYLSSSLTFHERVTFTRTSAQFSQWIARQTADNKMLSLQEIGYQWIRSQDTFCPHLSQHNLPNKVKVTRRGKKNVVGRSI